MNLLLDFDGTLVDIADKYWWVYTEFFRARGGVAPERAGFWAAKRDGASDAKLLALAGLNPELAEELRRHIKETVETEAALGRDQPLPEIHGLLSGLRERHALVLVSARNHAGNLRRQIERIGLAGFPFSELVIAGDNSQSLRPGETPKSKLLAGGRWLTGPALMVGDAKMDVQTAKALGIRGCAVLSGIRSRGFLERLQPDHIIDSVLQLPALLSTIR